MSRGHLAVHAHFYQPYRADPFGTGIPPDPSAAPYADWNSRITAECYRPIAERGTLGHLSFDVGPTLVDWLAEHEPRTWARFVAGDRPGGRDPSIPLDRGNAMAQAFHHTILPLASAADRRTEIRWGIRAFELRYGRRPEGLWLPETAADLATLRTLAEDGIRQTILAPWQLGDPDLDTRRPYRIDLGAGRSIAIAAYDRELSAAASFEAGATADADHFARERVAPRLADVTFADGMPLVVIATDGELYGHHQTFRDLFLHRLVTPGPDDRDRGFAMIDLATALTESPGRPFPAVHLHERTSWSCHHGVLRWSGECPCAPDGRWKAPLRAALERLAGGIDLALEVAFDALPGRPDPVAARDAYVDVVAGVDSPAAFSARWLGDAAPPERRHEFLELLDSARWRLAMFASDGWFWDEPDRTETRQVLRCAARAARLIDGRTHGRLEARLVDDLASVRSPVSGRDGAELYRLALAEVGQPPSEG